MRKVSHLRHLLFLVVTTACYFFSCECLIPKQHQHSRYGSDCFNTYKSGTTKLKSSSSDEAVSEAEQLLAKARALRNEISNVEETAMQTKSETNELKRQKLEWNVQSEMNGEGYRLYVDIGREQGTWMDPRWGASGKRIDFTLDVKFLSNVVSSPEVQEGMVKDNFGGKSSQVYALESAPYARLRSGFDKMKASSGGYRIDTGKNGASTIRFYINVDGVPEKSSGYGDIWIPKGSLFFSIPVFGVSLSQLSRKESPVTVRQKGFHTGWWREESRIVGTFLAKPIDEACQKDGF